MSEYATIPAGSMNAYKKIISDMTPYLSGPCAVEFSDRNEEIYIGIVEMGSKLIIKNVNKKGSVDVAVEFKKIARVHIFRSRGLFYELIDGKAIERRFTLDLTIVSSEIIPTPIGKKLELKCVTDGLKEKLTLYKEAADLIRIQDAFLTYA